MTEFPHLAAEGKSVAYLKDVFGTLTYYPTELEIRRMSTGEDRQQAAMAQTAGGALKFVNKRGSTSNRNLNVDNLNVAMTVVQPAVGQYASLQTVIPIDVTNAAAASQINGAPTVSIPRYE